MSFYIICCFFVIPLIQNEIFAQTSNEKDLLQWYYKQSRLPRQVDYDYNQNTDDNDDWYVFDRVDPPQNNGRNFQPTWQNNQNQINQNNWMTRTTPRNFFTTTTPQPAVPNAGPPRLPPCEENCNARTTSEYNPVCGTNLVTYYNNGRFECAQFCGLNIGIKNRGRCGPLIPPN